MKGYFEGWYFKHQANGKSLALIPGRAKDTAFIHVVTEHKAEYIPFPLSAFQKGKDYISIGENRFSQAGVKLDICTGEFSIKGQIAYSNLSTIRGDIMGPFQFFPMECRHGIISMNHALDGALTLNGEHYDFQGGRGYIESDSGRSFPEQYTWIHCNHFANDCSIMAAIAKIPFYGLKFMGIICVVWLNGREYRLATYNGAKILCCKPGVIELKRGKFYLSIKVDKDGGHMLPAPRFGAMDYFIRENLSCSAQFRFSKGNTVLFDEKSNCASYECELG